MEEVVALDSSKQKKFVKSIAGIKKILKGKDKAGSKKDAAKNVQTGKVKKPARKTKGLVYLSHIPHGFYEHEMTEYFKQFGVVTNARVIRSKRTGMSKGYAFVEFRDPNVAEIVAETMNNYLMGKRLIKAAVIPPEKQRKYAKRKHWNAQNNPGYNARQEAKKMHNSVKDDEKELKIARKLISNLNRTKKRLRELDIDYDFFTPVDVPEPLLNLLEVKKEEDIKTTQAIKEDNNLNNKVKQEDKIRNDSKQNKGKKAIDVKVEEPTLTKQVDSSADKKSKKSKEAQKINDKTNLVKASVKDNKKNTKKSNAETAEVPEKEENKKVGKKTKTQKQKEQKLKDAGVKPPENYIQIANECDDESESGSSVNFDSDEFDKEMNEDESDVESDDASDETDEELDEDVTSEEDDDESEENEVPLPKKVVKPLKTKNKGRQNVLGKQQVTTKLAPQMKKISQKEAKPSKKPKFEKKGKKTLNKVIKKKK